MGFEYDIGGKKFTQRKLVLGQVRQLIRLLPEIVIRAGATPLSILVGLDEKTSQALAIVLREEGSELKDKNVEALAAFLDENCDLDVAGRVIDDFFVLNPLSSLQARLEKMTQGLAGFTKKKEGSTGCSSSWPEATSRSETPSSGDTPQRSVANG